MRVGHPRDRVGREEDEEPRERLALRRAAERERCPRGAATRDRGADPEAAEERRRHDGERLRRRADAPAESPEPNDLGDERGRARQPHGQEEEDGHGRAKDTRRRRDAADGARPR